MPGAYYAWRVAGKPAEVLLSLSVVERLHAGVLHAQLRDGHTDAWGLLLGRSRKRGGVRTTIVEDYEPLHVMPKRGRLKAPEGSRLEVIGVYRSSPGETFRLDETDAALIGRAFHDPAMVFLLIRPERGHASHAAFFVQEEGLIHGYASYLVFPFHADLLSQRGPVEERVAPARHKRPWVAAAAVLAALLPAGAWYLRPVAEPALPAPPVAPVLNQQGTADRHKLEVAPGRVSPVKEAAKRKKRPRPSSIGSKSQTNSFVASQKRPPADPIATTPPERPNRFRRILSKVPGLGRLAGSGDRRE